MKLTRRRNRRGIRLVHTVLLAGLLLGGATASVADNYKLNGLLVDGGNIFRFSISADSSGVVYEADQDTDSVNELFSAPLAGGTAVKLNDPLVDGGSVASHRISTDSTRVVYLAEQDTDDIEELYSVPLAGGTVVKLNDALTDDRNIGGVYRISPDSSRVVYMADQQAHAGWQLYSVPLTGGTPVRLGDVDIDVVTRFLISPDSNHVVYLVGGPGTGGRPAELYSAPLSGGPAVALNPPPVAAGDVSGISISPDSGRVVYRADQDTAGLMELYSVPLTGGAAVKLNDPLVDGGSVASHRISTDSTRVVYLAEQDTAGLVELYSVPLTGGAAVKLNDPLVAGGNVGPFSISPDSTQVTYVADEDADDVTELELYSVPLIGGAAVRLHDRSTDGGDVLVLRSGIDRSWLGPRITSDSRRVVYMAGEYPEGDTDGMFELYSVPLTGGTPIKLNDPLAPGHGIWTFRVSPDSDLVVYLSGQVDEGALELYSVPVRGGAVFKLNGALVDGGFVGSNEISPDSSRVVYKAIQDQVQAPFGLFELYASTLQRPEHLIEALVETVIALNLRNGISNALDSKLQNVLSALEDANANNDDAAINVLYAFIYNVEAQRGKALSDAEADSLIADAQAIIDLLSQ